MPLLSKSHHAELKESAGTGQNVPAQGWLCRSTGCERGECLLWGTARCYLQHQVKGYHEAALLSLGSHTAAVTDAMSLRNFPVSEPGKSKADGGKAGWPDRSLAPALQRRHQPLSPHPRPGGRHASLGLFEGGDLSPGVTRFLMDSLLSLPRAASAWAKSGRSRG